MGGYRGQLKDASGTFSIGLRALDKTNPDFAVIAL
jgi:hypothetical protein